MVVIVSEENASPSSSASHLFTDGLHERLVNVSCLDQSAQHRKRPLAVVHGHGDIKALPAAKPAALGNGDFGRGRYELLGCMTSNLADELIHVNGFSNHFGDPGKRS